MGYWESMSEDLTYNIEPALSYRVISSIAGSPFDENTLAAGTADGRIWVTQNGGDTWEEMSEGLPDRYVTDIYFDPYDEHHMFCTVSGYRDYAYTPHVMRAEIGWVSGRRSLQNALCDVRPVSVPVFGTSL